MESYGGAAAEGHRTPAAVLVYGGLCFGLGAGLLIWLTATTPVNFPGAGAFLLFAGLTVLTMLWGFPAPRVGHVALDRIPVIAAILCFGFVEAAWIAVAASLAWPWLVTDASHTFSHRLVRALSNGGMFIFMVVAGGAVYVATGGPIPFDALTVGALGPVLLMAVVMQALNHGFIALIIHLQGHDFRHSFSPFVIAVEMGAVPAGLLTALAFNRLDMPAFLLFLLVLGGFIMVVNRFARTRQALEERVADLVSINRVGRAVNSSLFLEDLSELILSEAGKLVDFNSFYLVLYDEEHGELDFRLHHNDDGRQPRKRKPVGEGLLSHIVENNEPVLVEDWASASNRITELAVIVGEPPGSFIGVPISFNDRVLGVISIQSFRRGAFAPAQLNLMIAFAGHVGVALANARLYQELDEYKGTLETRVTERTERLESQKRELHQLSESLWETNKQKEQLLAALRQKTEALDRQSKEDGLTGLFNRRYMDERMAVEMRRARRHGHPMVVAMADLDFFKSVNDEYSHRVGDEVLKEIAAILIKECRATDVIARYGGEEFLLCFPETSLGDAGIAGEKIRQAVEGTDWRDIEEGLKVTLSMGVAAAGNDYSVEAMVQRADRRLYEAKRAGRNRVVLDRPDPATGVASSPDRK